MSTCGLQFLSPFVIMPLAYLVRLEIIFVKVFVIILLCLFFYAPVVSFLFLNETSVSKKKIVAIKGSEGKLWSFYPFYCLLPFTLLL